MRQPGYHTMWWHSFKESFNNFIMSSNQNNLKLSYMHLKRPQCAYWTNEMWRNPKRTPQAGSITSLAGAKRRNTAAEVATAADCKALWSEHCTATFDFFLLQPYSLRMYNTKLSRINFVLHSNRLQSDNRFKASLPKHNDVRVSTFHLEILRWMGLRRILFSLHPLLIEYETRNECEMITESKWCP